MLGTLIRDLADESKASEALLSIGDIALVARIEHARRGDMTTGAYAAAAVARFADRAGDEDWLSLMGKMERADDPAAACLGAMIEWSLMQSESHGRSCGSLEGEHHHD